MAIIIDLPAEIVEAIADQIEKWIDLIDFRATCRYIDKILTPRILSTIVFDFSNHEDARNLIRMANRPTRVHLFARTLRIRCLAPGANMSHAPHILMERGGNYKYLERSTRSDVLQAEAIVSQYLSGALRHFRHLEAVEWKTHAFDVGDANKSIMDLVCSQENLCKVSIDMDHDLSLPYPDLGRLSKLSELSIIFPRIHVRAGPLFSGTAQALVKCPDLTRLRIQIQPNYIHPDLTEFDQIYKSMASLHKLETLSLSIPTLHSLNEFSVLGNMSQMTSLELRTTDLTQGWNEVWEALRNHHIHLKSICFNMLDMDQSFVDYLSSYSGVEELLLSNSEHFWVDNAVDRTSLATSFFDVIVVKHATTLRVLEISLNSFSITWGNVSERHSRLAKLRVLKRLKVDLADDEIRAIKASTSDNAKRLRNLLDLVSMA